MGVPVPTPGASRPGPACAQARRVPSPSLSVWNVSPSSFPHVAPSFPFLPFPPLTPLPFARTGRAGLQPGQQTHAEFRGGGDRRGARGRCRAQGSAGEGHGAVEPSGPAAVPAALSCPCVIPPGEEKELESGKTSESTTVLKVPALRPFPRGPHREPRVEFKDPGAGEGRRGPRPGQRGFREKAR